MGVNFWNRNGIQLIVALWAIAALAITELLTWQVLLTILIAGCSNEFHAWAHGVSGNSATDFLQEMGIFQSPDHHNRHHVKPFEKRFCVITNYCNPILDRIKFWRLLEWLLSTFGIHPARCTEAREFV
jgi:ubiquitin-conjugating enzyme E2 variant